MNNAPYENRWIRTNLMSRVVQVMTGEVPNVQYYRLLRRSFNLRRWWARDSLLLYHLSNVNIYFIRRPSFWFWSTWFAAFFDVNFLVLRRRCCLGFIYEVNNINTPVNNTMTVPHYFINLLSFFLSSGSNYLCQNCPITFSWWYSSDWQETTFPYGLVLLFWNGLITTHTHQT